MSNKLSRKMKKALELADTMKPKDAAKKAGVTINGFYIARKRLAQRPLPPI
jgi:hypothetical protein